MHALITATAAVLMAAAAGSAAAQDYPNRPIRMIIPLTPGSGADIAGRIIGRYLNDAWHQPVIVENRPGEIGRASCRERV